MLRKPFGPLLRQYTVVIVANFAIMNLGLNVVWPSPVLVKLRDPNQTILPQPITEEEGAWITSIDTLTGACMFFVPGYLGDRIGRKNCMILASLPRIAVGFLFIFASDVWMLLLARAVGGVADVLALSMAPTYASEISSREIRGSLGTITQILSSIGMLITLSIGPFVSYLSLNIILTSLYTLLTIPMLFLPQSPYFLHSKGRTDDTVKVLTFLRGTEELAREEIKEYALNTNANLDKRELLRDKTFLKTMGMTLFLAIALQLIGSNTVTYYLQTIFESTQTSVSPEISSVIIGCIQLAACLCTIVLIDKFGRKPILTISLFGVAVGMIGLGVFFKMAENRYEIVGILNYLPLVSMILVIYCHNAGMGSLIWLLVAELFDGPARAFGVSINIFVTTFFVFLTTRFFGAVTNAITPALTYWMFSANCIITSLFILFVVPETKGKTFAEIQKALGRVIKK